MKCWVIGSYHRQRLQLGLLQDKCQRQGALASAYRQVSDAVHFMTDLLNEWAEGTMDAAKEPAEPVKYLVI